MKCSPLLLQREHPNDETRLNSTVVNRYPMTGRALLNHEVHSSYGLLTEKCLHYIVLKLVFGYSVKILFYHMPVKKEMK